MYIRITYIYIYIYVYTYVLLSLVALCVHMHIYIYIYIPIHIVHSTIVMFIIGVEEQWLINQDDVDIHYDKVPGDKDS